MSYEQEPLVTEEFIRGLISNCAYERAKGNFQKESMEGYRVADNFRMVFPEVSDRDLGTLIVVLVQALMHLSQCTAVNLSSTVEMMIASYSYSAADILKSVIDLGEL